MRINELSDRERSVIEVASSWSGVEAASSEPALRSRSAITDFRSDALFAAAAAVCWLARNLSRSAFSSEASARLWLRERELTFQERENELKRQIEELQERPTPATTTTDGESDLIKHEARLAKITERNYLDDLNPHGKKIIVAYVEPALIDSRAETRLQFERHGYFVADIKDSRAGAPVFNPFTTIEYGKLYAKKK